MAGPIQPEGYERPDHGDALTMEQKPLEDPKLDEGALLQIARERAVTAQSWWDENHNLAEHDVLFAEGLNQWEAADLAARAGEPSLTLNSIAAQIESVCGEQRQNRPAIHVHPADDHGASLEFDVGEGKHKRRVKGAEVYEGIIRAIEFKSGAEQHYDAAHRHAVDGAMGYLRVLTRYASGKDFDQELLIQRIKNRWSVLLDPDAEQPDYSDAAYGFVGSDMLRTEYDRRYPDKPIGDLVGSVDARFWGARSQAKVRVCEYFTREAHERELVLLSNGQIAYMDEIKDVVDELQREGVGVARSRKVMTWCVYWRKITAWAVLEGPIKMPFTTIPIVPVFGRERNLRDGRTLYSSLHRQAKDPLRMSNYWWSAATARVGAAPKPKWIGPAEAFEGHENEWRRANIDNQVYLPFSGDIPPTQIAQAPMPVAEVQMATSMGEMVKVALGLGAPAMTDVTSEASGRALRTRKAAENTGTFAFTDNLSGALRRVGLLLIEAIPQVYDTQRVMRLRNEDGTGEWVKVNQVVVDEQTGKEVVINALGSGEFDVSVSAGPSYATLRQETADMQMQMLQIAPNLVPIIGDKVIENQDWPQAKETALRVRRSMPQELLTQAERDELQGDAPPGPDGQPQPSPEQQAAQQQAEMMAQQQALAMQVAQKEADAKSAAADADMAQAEAKKAQAVADLFEAQLKLQMLQTGGIHALRPPPTSATQPAVMPGSSSNGTGAPHNDR